MKTCFFICVLDLHYLRNFPFNVGRFYGSVGTEMFDTGVCILFESQRERSRTPRVAIVFGSCEIESLVANTLREPNI